jgi:DNA polymerase-3 subunit epsilon
MKILIIDIETTDFLQRHGEIVELGIVELDLETAEKKIIFNKIIKPKIGLEELRETWIVKNGYMKPEDIVKGVEFSTIKEEVQKIIDSYPDGVTAYNIKFDVGFLESYGMTFPKLLPCPMIKSTSICKLPGRYGNYKWPKAEEAYKHFYPEVEYTEAHRGADDAMHEADIVLALHKLGKFI